MTFSVRHLMIARTHGRFEQFQGTVNFDEQNPVNSSVDVSIDTASINTMNEQRDTHLKSNDFLDVATFPSMTFVSKRIEVVSANRGKIYGDLTIRGVTREVALSTEYNGQSKSPWGATSAGFSATTRINRKEWGLEWNVALETGGILVGDDVDISIDIEIIKDAG
ncbi:YceI family protein [Oscillochloris trichoides DG-6]|uniref:YceI family protein n=1 Tax=Oscillochloris trichoides DG-6 TaxID=765420 RepID=E1ICK3_9CHLR|nr:YceI family protein [Oscillochloris trichoides DG-6]